MSSPRRPIFSFPTGPPRVSVRWYLRAARCASCQATFTSCAGAGSVRWNDSLRCRYVVFRCFWLMYVWIAVNGSSQRQTTTTQASVRTPATIRTVPKTRSALRTLGLASAAEVAGHDRDRLIAVHTRRVGDVDGGAAHVLPRPPEDVRAVSRRREPEVDRLEAVDGRR